MAKKSRRNRTKHQGKSRKTVQHTHPQQLNVISNAAQSPSRMSSEPQDFAGRYQYVMPEIKLIGIIAGSMILLLIILGFILG